MANAYVSQQASTCVLLLLQGWTPLMCASYAGEIQLVKLLLKHNAKTHLSNSQVYSTDACQLGVDIPASSPQAAPPRQFCAFCVHVTDMNQFGTLWMHSPNVPLVSTLTTQGKTTQLGQSLVSLFGQHV